MKTKFKGIRTIDQYRRGELVKDILRLIGAGVVVGAAVAAPNTVQLLDMFDPKGRSQRNKIWKAIKHLENLDRIQIEKTNGEDVIVLTKKGRRVLDDILIEELAISPPHMWDRKWRLVMFDIPTYKGSIRREFREKIQDLGFEMYQKSVFIHPYECREEVIAIATFYDVREHVRYLTAEEVPDMREFVRKFDLL